LQTIANHKSDNSVEANGNEPTPTIENKPSFDAVIVFVKLTIGKTKTNWEGKSYHRLMENAHGKKTTCTHRTEQK